MSCSRVTAAAASVLAAALVLAALVATPLAFAANGLIAVELQTEDCSPSLDCLSYPEGVVLAAPDGSVARRLPVSSSFDPQFSHDGRLLALRVQNRGIVVGRSDGRNFRYVDRADWAAYEGMDWSPRSNQLVYAKTYESVTQSTTKLFRVSADTGRRRTLGTGRSPIWSPDGRWIAFEPAGYDWQVMVMRADGRGRRALTHFTDDSTPMVQRWSRDGRMVLFTREVRGEDVLFGVDVTTGHIVRIVPQSQPAGLLSPDGRLRASSGEDGVYVALRDGSHRRRVMGSPRHWGADVYVVGDWQYVP